MRNIRIRAIRQGFCEGIAILISEESDARIYAAKNVVLELVDEGAVISPTLSIGPTEAQVLMDNLWDCGIRPSEGSGSAGAMAATQRHLEDMRMLVFKTPDNRMA